MDDYDYITSEEIEKIKVAMESNGLERAAAVIQAHLESSDNVELNIAITGESGSGKSTFVNAFRGLDDEHPEAASSGVTETTVVPTKYTYPKFDKVFIWDLPGIGTPNFKAEEYLEKVNFKTYDFFIIIASERFKSSGVQLANEIQKMKKTFYFVRSKIDDSLRAAQRRKNYNEEETLELIQQDCVRGLQELDICSPKVFLISSFELNLYDFPKLEETIEKELPKHKRHVLLLTLPNMSFQVNERKRKSFRANIWKLATVSCLVATVPIPGLSVVCDVTILVTELRKYYKAFGLDDESLQNLANRVKKPIQELKSVLKSPLTAEISKDVVIKLLTKFAGAKYMVVEYVFTNIPVIGSVIAGSISYKTTSMMLHSCLNELADDASNVLKKAFESEM
ncbi:interferon-inducible GTPase 5-like [Erpetoichthys calabaricus]|uniref:Interferon-inducible GTPase 5-like n=1 Tax=Erpetoichthys calabaricus TaxID=27687 RepID=A0A8C4XEA8_ERPCA|nr:interferon-inducible GTPase 5-like [Erpetoichthys calabaricus]XP_028678272.1 interferon-inducible GTPase 5-like [Erpetoichthys calabaricus]